MSDASQSTTEEQADEHELLDLIREAIVRLPERLRVAITATYLEGRSGLEVSELLGVSPSRVSQLRAEALVRLRSELAPVVDIRFGHLVDDAVTVGPTGA
jgi:RNA polymerase sigma factor for flagellar operon FliA